MPTAYSLNLEPGTGDLGFPAHVAARLRVYQCQMCADLPSQQSLGGHWGAAVDSVPFLAK